MCVQVFFFSVAGDLNILACIYRRCVSVTIFMIIPSNSCDDTLKDLDIGALSIWRVWVA